LDLADLVGEVEVVAFGVPLAPLDLSRLFRKRLSEPLANPRFHHPPDPAGRPKLEAHYHNSDKAIGAIVDFAVPRDPLSKAGLFPITNFDTKNL